MGTPRALWHSKRPIRKFAFHQPLFCPPHSRFDFSSCSCCCVASRFLHALPAVPAGVAVHSILVAAVHRALWLEWDQRFFSVWVCPNALSQGSRRWRDRERHLSATNPLDNRRSAVDGFAPLRRCPPRGGHDTISTAPGWDSTPSMRCSRGYWRRRKEATSSEVHGQKTHHTGGLGSRTGCQIV